MRYRTHGTRLAALLLVAIMALSVFAMPVAATSTVGEVADDRVSADEVTDGEIVDTTFTINVDDDVDQDTETTFILNSEVVDEGDIEIISAEIDGTDETDEATVSVENGGVFGTTDDTIVLSFEDDISPSDDNVDIDVEYEISSVADDKADTYTGASVIEVGEESDLSGLNPEDTVATLDIVPGNPASILLDNVEDIAYDDGSTAVTVTAEDSQENLIQESSFDNNIQDNYDADLDLEATLLDSNNEEVDSEVIDSIELDSSENDDEATFEIDDEGDDITDLVVGDDLTIEVDEDGSEYDPTAGSEDIVIEPDDVNVEVDDDTEFNADVGAEGVSVSHELQDGEGETISEDDIDNITVSFTNEGTGDLFGVTLEAGDATIVSDEDSDASVSIEDTDIELTLTVTDNDFDDLEIQSEVEEGSSPAGSTDGINVLAGSPDLLTFAEDDNDVEEELDLGVSSVTVQVEDAHENVVDDRNFGTTTVQVTLTGAEELEDRSTVDDLSLSEDGTLDITFTEDDSASDEILAAVGEFDFEVTQTNPSPATEDLDIENLDGAVFYPNVDVTDQPEGLVDAGDEQQDDVTVNFEDSGETSLGDIHVDSIDVGVTFDNNSMQGDRDAEDLTASINGEQTTLHENDEDQVATIADVTEGDIDVTWESETAGLFEIDFDAIPSVDEDATQDTTEEIEVRVEEIDPAQSDISIENDFVGTIVDDADTEFTIELRDEFDNYADYTDDNDNVGDGSIHLDVAEQNIEGDLFEESDGVETNVDEADGSITYDFDSAEDLAHYTETGDANVEVIDDAPSETVTVTEQIELVHEAFDLDEDFQRISVPAPAEISEESLDHATTWNTTGDNYDSDDVALTDGVVDDDATLHHGLYVNGQDDDARFGLDFVEEGQAEVSPGNADLEAGWNFIGTNADFSEEENNPLKLETDLLSVTSIEEDPNADQFVKDGGLSNLLDADGDSDTSDLNDAIDATGNGEYGTYWVYVEDPDGSSDWNRNLVGPNYDTYDRNKLV